MNRRTVLGLLTVLWACGGGDDDQESTSTAPSQTNTTLTGSKDCAHGDRRWMLKFSREVSNTPCSAQFESGLLHDLTAMTVDADAPLSSSSACQQFAQPKDCSLRWWQLCDLATTRLLSLRILESTIEIKGEILSPDRFEGTASLKYTEDYVTKCSESYQVIGTPL